VTHTFPACSHRCPTLFIVAKELVKRCLEDVLRQPLGDRAGGLNTVFRKYQQKAEYRRSVETLNQFLADRRTRHGRVAASGTG